MWIKRKNVWLEIAEAFDTPIHLRTKEQSALTSSCLTRAYHIITDDLNTPLILLGNFTYDEAWSLPGREDLRPDCQLIRYWDDIRVGVALFMATLNDKEYGEILKDDY